MEVTIYISIFFLFIVLLWMIFRPAISFSFGIIGGFIMGAFIGGFLRFSGGVSLAWLILIILGALIVKIKYRMPLWENTLDEWLVVALALAILVSLRYTPSPVYGKYKALLFLGTGTPLFYLGRICGRAYTSAEDAFKSGFVVSGMIIVLYALAFAISRGSMGMYDRFGEGESIMIGAWLNMAIAFQMFALFGGNLFQKVLSVSLIIIAIAIIPFTGSRGALASLVLGAGITFLNKQAFFRSCLALLFIGITLFVVLKFIAPEAMLERLGHLTYAESGRAELFPLAATTFLNHPVRGIGAGGFSYVYPNKYTGNTDYRTYPHNLWLETACEQGLMGLIPLGILTFLGFKRIFWIRKYFDAVFSRSCQMLFWVVTFQVAFTGDLPMNRGLFAVYGLLAGLRQCYNKENQEYMSSQSMDYDNVDLIS